MSDTDGYLADCAALAIRAGQAVAAGHDLHLTPAEYQSFQQLLESWDDTDPAVKHLWERALAGAPQRVTDPITAASFGGLRFTVTSHICGTPAVENAELKCSNCGCWMDTHPRYCAGSTCHCINPERMGT